MKHSVLVVATSKQTRGGITSVVQAHQRGKQWEKYNCKWIETHIDSSKFLSILYLIKGLFKYIFKLPLSDLVHIHLSEPVSAIRKSLFFIPAFLLRKKIIVHFHSFSPDTTIKGKFRGLYKFLFSHADKVIVLSNYWKNCVYDCFLIDNIEVIYNPCTTEILESKYERRKQILYAGTLNQRKGYADMIESFSMIAKDFPEWKIVFIGNGEIEQGKQLALNKGISSQTEFLGWKSGSDKDKIFKESSIFCLPSYAEGFPMAVLDACAYGLPVITTPVGGIPDVAKPGENMLLFKPGDIKKLAENMKQLISDNFLYKKLEKESLNLSANQFNLKVINSEIESVYNNLLN